MECPHCQSPKTVKNGKDYHKDGKAIQNYLCKGCGKNETPSMAIGLCHRSISMLELLSLRGFTSLTA
ncbi:MAG: transposase [Prochlorotrichaceae cyanobacterium]